MSAIVIGSDRGWDGHGWGAPWFGLTSCCWSSSSGGSPSTPHDGDPLRHQAALALSQKRKRCWRFGSPAATSTGTSTKPGWPPCAEAGRVPDGAVLQEPGNPTPARVQGDPPQIVLHAKPKGPRLDTRTARDPLMIVSRQHPSGSRFGSFGAVLGVGLQRRERA